MEHDADDAGVETAFSSRIRRILSRAEQADFEVIDPPLDLWAQIEAAASAPSPRVAPSRDSSANTVVEYRIDAADVVIEVGQSWADFARDNDAPELAVPPPDRTLWSYFDREDVRDVWRLLVERVRALQKGAEVPLRCDAPDARRWFEMAITPESDGRVHFRCDLVFEEARRPLSLLDTNSERDLDLEPVPLCSWCGQAQRGSRWVDIEELVRAERLLERSSMPPVTYGICASCRDEMSAELLVHGGREV